MQKFFLFPGLCICIFVLANCDNTYNNSTSSDDSTSANNPIEIDGKKIYKQYCVLCHGSDGKKGLNKAADLTKSTESLDKRMEIITHGRGLMTPFRGVLTLEEIKAVAQYTMEMSDEQ